MIEGLVQLGLDFGEAPQAHAELEAPPGTWSEPEGLTTAEYEAYLSGARECIPGLTAFLQVLYRHALELAAEALADRQRVLRPGADRRFRLSRVQLNVTEATFRQFVEHCATEPGPGIERRVRHEYGHLSAGVHVEGVGSLIGTCWRDCGFALDYAVGREDFFAPSFRDEMPRFEVSSSVWAPAYAGDRFASAYDRPARVPAFTYEGQRYVNTGGLSHGRYRECDAWTLVAREAWAGPTCTYAELCRAWDEGRIERGYKRGLLVRVCGQLAVLDRPVLFFDPGSSFDTPVVSTDDGVAEEDDWGLLEPEAEDDVTSGDDPEADGAET